MMELQSLSKSYAGVPAVADVSLTIEDDEYLTLLGPSGSGKSTLLRLIAGLERPDSGVVRLDGDDLTARPPHRRGLGVVQQNYALFPHMTVEENVAFGLRWREVDPVTDDAELARRVGAMLELVGLTGLESRSVGAISGGQKQRVSLARTLVTEPRICLLDEPLGALDANLRERMTLELLRIRETLGVSFMHVTGNEAEALSMGDRMIVLDEGRAIMVAHPGDVFDAPATVRVARFLNAYNLMTGASAGDGFVHGGARLPPPGGPAAGTGAATYAVRYDAASIVAPDDPSALMPARFITSEFTGGGVTYFLRGPEGVFEVERHLSRADPVDYAAGADVALTWDPADALLFDGAGRLIDASAMRGAA
ncbi:MAG: ABC transporter ATP-binding protein [Pseudomonadota bacterium]